MAISESVYRAQVMEEVERIPPEYLAPLLQILRAYRASVTLATEHHQVAAFTEEPTVAEMDTEDEQWDRLFAREDAQRVMLEMAREALAEEKAGLTVEMAFDEDGNLIEPS